MLVVGFHRNALMNINFIAVTSTWKYQMVIVTPMKQNYSLIEMVNKKIKYKSTRTRRVPFRTKPKNCSKQCFDGSPKKLKR